MYVVADRVVLCYRVGVVLQNKRNPLMCVLINGADLHITCAMCMYVVCVDAI